MTNDPSREGSRDRQASGQWSAPGPLAADPSGRAAAAPPVLAASGHGYPHEQWPGSPDLGSTHDYGPGPGAGHTGPARRERGRAGLRHGDPPDGHRSEPSGFSPAEFAERGPELAPADFAPRAGYEHPGGSASWPGDPVETAYGKPYSGQPYAPPADPTGSYPRPPQFDATGPHPAVELNRTGTLRAPAADRTGAHAAPAIPSHNAGLVAYEPRGYGPTGHPEQGHPEKGYAETQYSGAPRPEQPYAEQPYAEQPYPADPGYEPPAAQRTGYPPAPYGSPALPAAPSPAEPSYQPEPAYQPEPMYPAEPSQRVEPRFEPDPRYRSEQPYRPEGQYQADGPFGVSAGDPYLAEPQYREAPRQPAGGPPHQHTGAYPAAPQTGAHPADWESPEQPAQWPEHAQDPGDGYPPAANPYAEYTGAHPARPLTAFKGGPIPATGESPSSGLGTEFGSDPGATTFIPPITSRSRDGEETGMYATITSGAAAGATAEPAEPGPDPDRAPADPEKPILVRRPRRRITARKLAKTAVVLLVAATVGLGAAYYFTLPKLPVKAPAAGGQEVTGVEGKGPRLSGVLASPVPANSRLATRATDPAPLKLTELSAPSYTALAGEYTRTGIDVSVNCATAADPSVAATLKPLGCTQVVSVTAVNTEKGCVTTFGALNLPDQASAGKLVEAMRDGKIGSFVPRTHGKAAEGKAGGADSTWWFLMAPRGHWVAFATSAYASGTKITGRDAALVDCDTDLLRIVQQRLDTRK